VPPTGRAGEAEARPTNGAGETTAKSADEIGELKSEIEAMRRQLAELARERK
jgi:HAMP domain-containing protein